MAPRDMCGSAQVPADGPAATDEDASPAAAFGESKAWEWVVGSLCGLHQIASMRNCCGSGSPVSTTQAPCSRCSRTTD